MSPDAQAGNSAVLKMMKKQYFMNDNNFNSLDRLLEFGMGLGIAQQMMGVMNRAFNEMHVPNNGIAVSNVRPGYFAMVGEHPVGPLADSEIQSLVEADSLTADSFIWREGMPGWKQAKNVPEVYKYIILKSARK